MTIFSDVAHTSQWTMQNFYEFMNGFAMYNIDDSFSLFILFVDCVTGMYV